MPSFQHLFSVLCFILICTSSTFAQSSLSGTISDANSGPIFFATIGLYNQQDSLLAKATSSDNDGKYVLENIKDGTYYLQVNMLGYNNQVKNELDFPSMSGQSLDLSLTEASEILDGVTIKARVPVLEQRADRLIVNVGNSVTSLNGSLLDVMKKVPGMIVTGDRLRMAGQSNVTILINGKTTRYMDVESLLRDMPGDNIDKVEVIHQPGAEFEASGTGSIINIILKKNSLAGTNGSANIGVGKGKNWNYKTGVSLSHYKGNVNITAGLGYRNRSYWEQLILTRTINGDVYDQTSTDPHLGQNIRGNLGLDWNITDKHRVGFTSRLIKNATNYDIVGNTDIDYLAEEVQDLKFRTTNSNDKSWDLTSINPYYAYEIDTSGQKIEFDFSYANFNRGGRSTLSNELLGEGVNFPGQQFDSDGKTYITATKLDYHLPVNNNIQLNFGAKYSYADLDNDFQAFDQNSNGDFVLNDQSNRFLFTERVAAAYGKMTWKKAKWNGTVGLRYEDSFSEGKSAQLDTLLSRSIQQLFPSISIGREIKGPIGATIAYSYRIERPNYNSLNPFRFYLDPLTFNAGNPNLRPALTHSAKFNLTYESQPFFNIEYKESKDAIVQIIDQNDAAGTTNQTDVNLEKYSVFNTSLFFPLDFIPKISGYSGVIANYAKYESELRNTDFLRSRWSYTAFVNATFTLPFDIDSEVTGWYNSGELDGILTGSWLYGVDMGFSKKILKNKGKISIGVENLFYRPFYGVIEYSTIDLDVLSQWDAPVVNAQFSYKFGNQFMKKKQNVGGSGNDMINRAQ